jgi:outer membrane protein
LRPVIILILVLTIIPAASSPAQPPVTLTFEQALGRALRQNKFVGQARHEIAVAEANRDYLVSAVLPRIVATGDLTRNSMEQSFGDGQERFTILPRNDWGYRLTLSQPLYAGRREFRAHAQAKIGVENAREGSLAAEDAILLRVASNYLAIVNADRRVEVERRNIDLAERRRTQAQAFLDAGELTRVDVLRAETAMKAAQRLLAVAEQQREHAVAQLRIDLDVDGPIVVTAPDQTLPPLPDEAELIARTSSRPDVDIAENNVRIADLEVRKQRGFWLPTVTFDGGWIAQKSPFPAANFAYGALRFNVPIFQSGEVLARVAGAKSREKQAELALEETRLAAREDVRRALADLHSAETGLQLANEQLIAAQAEYDQAFELYRAQEATSLDLSASETSLAEARRAVAEESLNRDLAELRVWYAAGAMKEAVVTRLNGNGVTDR